MTTNIAADLREAEADDNAREIALLRSGLKAELDAAQAALRAAARFTHELTSNRVYDVEIVEGPGQHATAVLNQMVVTLAGVRALTVEAGR